MKILSNGITRARGFKSAGIHCGIKKKRLDLGLFFSEYPAKAAALFTTNKLRAPHIEIDKKHIKNGNIQAILVNSGNANCYNGEKGFRDAGVLIKDLSKTLKLSEESILFASTGVIGKLLPVALVKKKLPALVKKLGIDTHSDFAHSILTTDKKTKELFVKVKLDGKEVVIAGCAKGSGMIHPHMATTLCFIATDAEITKRALKKALKISVDNSLNLISIDGDMSPNDSVVILANGQAKNKTIDIDSNNFTKFLKALNSLLSKLSEMLVEDAEGSTKVVEIKIKNAKTLKDARKLAFSIANSNLVKTAFYGEDANWGRVVSCVGSSGVYLKPEKVEISFDNVKIFKDLKPVRSNEKSLKKVFKKHKIRVTVNLNVGCKETTVLTCDLTREYVNINANYRT